MSTSTLTVESASATEFSEFDGSDASWSRSEVALDRLVGQVGRIVRLELPDSFACRLKAMGLFVGQDVVLARQGNPMIVKAAGLKIALAREVASQIIVQHQG